MREINSTHLVGPGSDMFLDALKRNAEDAKRNAEDAAGHQFLVNLWASVYGSAFTASWREHNDVTYANALARSLANQALEEFQVRDAFDVFSLARFKLDAHASDPAP